MRIFIIFFMAFQIVTFSQQEVEKKVEFIPIQHASFIIQFGDLSIFVDPDGSLEKWKDYSSPDIILSTHAHNDHCNVDVISNKATDATKIIGAAKSIEKIGRGQVIKNGETITVDGIKIEVIPAYNTTEDRLNFHPKGDGNGYILTINNERIYIAGDTEDIPEMRSLKNIDYAFIPMNLPYTMTVEQAISAVLEFQPKFVYPYHYKTDKMESDIMKFSQVISMAEGINVALLKWYDE